MRSKTNGTDSTEIKRQVLCARQMQARRFGNDRTTTNSAMTHKQVEQFCVLDTESEMMLKHAMEEFALSGRAHDKICKVARTIADIENTEKIAPEHLAEAVGYRKLDRRI